MAKNQHFWVFSLYFDPFWTAKAQILGKYGISTLSELDCKFIHHLSKVPGVQLSHMSKKDDFVDFHDFSRFFTEIIRVWPSDAPYISKEV